MCARQYYSYPTQTSVQIRLESGMNFPAVTICSGNPFRYDKIRMPLNYYIVQNNISSDPTSMTYFQSVSAMFNFILELFNENNIDQIRSYGFQLDDILLNCTYNGIDCLHNSNKVFVESISITLGNCYTFNAKTLTQSLYKINDIEKGLILENGLVLTLYINSELYTPIYNYGIGLTAMVHDNVQLPLVKSLGNHFQPGMEHQIIYRKSEVTYLGSPFTPCTTTISADMQALYSTLFGDAQYDYSQSICYELCQQTYIYQQCQCVLPVYFYIKSLMINDQLISVNACYIGTEQEMCAYRAKQTFVNNISLQVKSCIRCQQQCQIVTFDTDITALKGPTTAQKQFLYQSVFSQNTTIPLQADFQTNYDSYIDNNYLKLTVICGSQYVTTYQEKTVYTWTALLSDIGGQSG
ncbi:unnamed protein product, partial [Didymodactylos carnosus]